MVPMVLVKTNRLSSASTAASKTWRSPSTLARNSGCGVAQPCAGVDDAVEDVVAACHGGAQCGVVEDVAVVIFDVEVLDRLRRAGPANQHPHVVAAVDQLAGDMGAEEPARADHQLLRACHAVKCSGGKDGIND
jgi:hypothetical protein